MAGNADDSNLRNDLIEKSIEIFSTKGYIATNLTDITDALGVSRGPVYYHFKDKYGLYEAAFDRFEKEVREAHRDIFSQEKHIIKHIEDMIVNCVEQYKRFGLNFLTGLDTVEELYPIRDRYYNLAEEIYGMKIDLVKKAMEKGEIRRSIDPTLIVDLVYVIYGGLTSGLTHPLSNISDAETKNLFKILLLGVERFCCD